MVLLRPEAETQDRRPLQGLISGIAEGLRKAVQIPVAEPSLGFEIIALAPFIPGFYEHQTFLLGSAHDMLGGYRAEACPPGRRGIDKHVRHDTAMQGSTSGCCEKMSRVLLT